MLGDLQTYGDLQRLTVSLDLRLMTYPPLIGVSRKCKYNATHLHFRGFHPYDSIPFLEGNGQIPDCFGRHMIVNHGEGVGNGREK